MTEKLMTDGSPKAHRLLVRAIATGLALSMAGVGFAAQAPADTRLADAAEQHDVAAVRALLSRKGVNVNVPQPDGSTAMLWAAHHDDLEMADLLIRAGADVKVKNQLGVAPLAEAAQNGSAGMVERLLKAGADANIALYDGNTPLMLASRAGNAATVKLLLASGAKVDDRDGRSGATPLMWAAAENHADIVKVLVEVGADVNAVSSHVTWLDEVQTKKLGTLYSSYPTGGLTPLLHAVRENAYDAVDALLAVGADPNKTTPEGVTPLTVATANAHWDVANLLIEKGANADDGSIVEVAEMVAFSTFVHPYSTRPNTLDGIDVMKAMLKHGAKPDRRLKGLMPDGVLHPGQGSLSGPTDQTALYRAAAAADVRMMQILFDAGADLNIALKDGSTPLIAAAALGVNARGRTGENGPSEEQRTAAVQFCLDHGANLEAVDEKGMTAFHKATEKNFDVVIEYLAKKGAKVDAKNKDGKTALDIANVPSRTPTPVREATVAVLEKLGVPAGSPADAAKSAEPRTSTAGGRR